jgi:hypothetical protein
MFRLEADSEATTVPRNHGKTIHQQWVVNRFVLPTLGGSPGQTLPVRTMEELRR